MITVVEQAEKRIPTKMKNRRHMRSRNIAARGPIEDQVDLPVMIALGQRPVSTFNCQRSLEHDEQFGCGASFRQLRACRVALDSALTDQREAPVAFAWQRLKQRHGPKMVGQDVCLTIGRARLHVP